MIGSKTFGKGSVQTIVPLQDGAGLRMTTAHYFTPSGRSIQVKGIIPDIIVPFMPIESSEVSTEKENGITREKDLKNHFHNSAEDLNTNQEQVPTETPAETSTEQNSNLEPDVGERLKKDNQLRTALNILRGISLLSEVAEEVN